jgi:dethiobiotin synthetase
MMKKGFFVTGTDTGVGKTWATVALMRYFKNKGFSVVGMKPVAAGCEWHHGLLKNEDAVLLQENASIQVEYKEVNPYAFEMPVSPHIAAMETPVQLDVIKQSFDQLKTKADVVLVEGAGGWLAPLNNQHDIADLAMTLQLPVILVVAIRLGCINHARLTLQAIIESNVECAGWVAMCLDPELQMIDENIEMISSKLSVPLLGVLPYTAEKDFNDLAKYFERLDRI